MTELAKRRRAIMAGSLSREWLYNHGILSTGRSLGTSGYKYGSYVSQEQTQTALRIYTANQFQYRGGRTFNILPALESGIGKTLVVSGYAQIDSTVYKNSVTIYAVISPTVVDTTNVLDVETSGSFPNGIFASTSVHPTSTVNEQQPFSVELPITQTGTVSIVGRKDDSAKMSIYIEEVYIK